MKHFLCQICSLLLALILLYSVLLGISLLLVPQVNTQNGVDSAIAPDTLFMTDAKYVFLSRTHFDTSVDKAIFVGASNVMVGFRQKQVQNLVPHLVVNNLGIGGTNMTEVRQIIDLVEDVQSPEARKHNIFIIGIWYGLFADDNPLWYTPDRIGGDTNIDVERYRYGFYRRTDRGPQALLPPSQLALGVMLIHPYLVLNRLCHDATKVLRVLLFARDPERTDAERDATIVSDAEKRKYLAMWQDNMGHATNLSDAPFELLKDTIHKIVASGGRVVIVDLPLPHWHAEATPLFASFQQHDRQLRNSFSAQSNVVFLDMQDMSHDNDFSDEVHPKPHVQPLWAKRIAPTLNALSHTP